MTSLATYGSTHGIRVRHDGHHVKDKSYFNKNDDIAKVTFWIAVLFVLAALGMRRLVLSHLQRQRSNAVPFTLVEGGQQPLQHRNKPYRISHFLQWILYPRRAFLGRTSSLSQAEILFFVTYLALTWTLLLTNVFFESSSSLYSLEWDVVGFRAAWIATTQLPLLYCTSGRVDPIKAITGISDTFVKRLHALVGINIGLVLIVHWASFVHLWDVIHLILDTFQQRPMVIWGFAAWAIFALTIVASCTGIRSRWYEPWLISHIFLGFAALLFSYIHTRCTTYFVLASVLLLVANNLGKTLLFLQPNLHLGLVRRPGQPVWGYRAHLEVLDRQYLRLQIKDPTFKWKPGQHIYINAPKLRIFESHPFTIANLPTPGQKTQDLSLVIKKHDGFTRALYRWASKTDISPLHINVLGPLGKSPRLDNRDTIILIASGNRASFVFPLVEDLCIRPGRLTTVVVHLIFPNKRIIGWYSTQLERCQNLVQQQDLSLHFILHVTAEISSVELQEASSITHLDHERISALGPSDMDELHFDLEASGNVRDSEESTLLPPGTDRDSTKVQLPLHARAFEHSTPMIQDKIIQTHPPTCTESNEPGTNAAWAERAQLLASKESAILGDFNLNVSYGRPSAQVLIEPIISESPSHAKIMVVAAVGQSLLQDVASRVSLISKDIMLGRHRGGTCHNLPRSIELWHESNG